MRPPPVVVVGDTLLDVDVEGRAEGLAPDAPVPVVAEEARHRRPGGAGLAALLAARQGADVTLVTAIGDDPAGRELYRLLAAHVRLVRLPLRGETVTKTRIRARGQSVARIDHGDGRAAGSPGGPQAVDKAVERALERALGRAVEALRGAGAVLVSDYGRGVADVLRPHLGGLTVPVVWDPHPRGGLPVPGCALVTPNEVEARLLGADPDATSEQAAVALVRSLAARAVAVTVGGRGAVLAEDGDRCARVPARGITALHDACGAGDRFAAAAAVALRDGRSAADAVAVAVAEATRFVAAGGASAVRVTAPVNGGLPPGPLEVAEHTHASGGRLVATGGCFDLLHAGHVSLLRRARELGDALIVCVNSDESVRSLKGAGRPVVRERDRMEVLRALSFVDAVLLFDEPTPLAVIARLCPHVWVKGGDYDAMDLPEAQVVRRYGGEVVILPGVPGVSTTSLITAARAVV